jgi:hypothetical protein|tara:strand:- start:12235 stop:12384 length:150 start_codon:yes stop_codon:yes gene_type:complete
MSINGMKKLLSHLERRLPYAIDITEYNQIKGRMKEIRSKIKDAHMRSGG